MFNKNRLTIISGAFGTGKTEIAINLAIQLRQKGIPKVLLIDLDIVNVYFRSRQKAYELEKLGIHVISTQKGLENADLPALSPEIFSAFRAENINEHTSTRAHERTKTDDVHAIFDLGGSDLGGVVLSRFHDDFGKIPYNHWLVVNPYRPFNLKNEDTLEIAGQIEARSRLPITGMIANPHLLDETNLAVIRNGYEQVKKITTYPLLLLSVMEKFYTEDLKQFINCPILIMKKEMKQPWEVGGIRMGNVMSDG